MKILFTASFTLIVLSVFAQEDSTSRELEQVVLTGQYKPQSVKNSVYQVRTITKLRIQQQGATRLQDVLNNELNIRFNQDLATGGSDITMLGLAGQNVKILVDGLPMVGRQGTSNEIDINQIDINSIERIEIVEGPMSVIYGADALAGVINIITKKSGAAKLSVTARLHEESIGNEYGTGQGIHNQHIGLAWRNQHWDLGGGFSKNYFSGWKDTALDRELVWHKRDQLLANGFIGYHAGKFNIRYRFEGLDEIISNPGNFINPQQNSGDILAYDQEYLSQRMMHQLQGRYALNSNVGFQFQSSYSDYSRQVFSTTVSKNTGNVRLDLGTGRQSIVNFSGFTFRGMSTLKFSTVLSIQPGIDINLDRGDGERLKSGSNAVDDYAVFITAEVTPTSKINIRPGLRFIKNSVYDAPPVIPSINSKFNLTNNLDLRLSYARGFRSPSLRELYLNFIDASHQIIGNPDLKSETSNSLTGSLNWKKTGANKIVYTAALGAFYNQVKNLIGYAQYAPDPTFTTLINISTSKTAGVNLNGSLAFAKLTIHTGVSETGFYNQYAADDETLPTLQWSAELNSTISYAFTKLGLHANLFYKFTGKRPLYVTDNNQKVVLGEQQGYHMGDITLSKKAFRYLLFTAGVRNVFDVDRVTNSYISSSGAHSSGGARNIACGRSYFAGVTFNWDRK